MNANFVNENKTLKAWMQGSVAYLELNRAECKNAISKSMWLEIPKLMTSLQEQNAKVLVLKGQKGIFAAGADLNELKELDSFESVKEMWDSIKTCLDFVSVFNLPVIAAIDGPCLGGGALLAIACDLRYASNRSVFSIPIARLGIVLDDLNISRLVNLVGFANACEIIYRACVFDSCSALKMGLINAIYPDDEFEQKIENIAQEISHNSTQSLVEAKLSIARISAIGGSMDNIRAVLSSYLSPEFRERIKLV